MPSAENVIIVMKEEGIDVSNNKRNQLTQGMLKKYDKVIVLARKEECPSYLVEFPKTFFWDIPDAKETDYSFHIKTRDLIKVKVKNLIKEIES